MKLMDMKAKVILSLFIVLFLTSQAFAGWMVESVNRDTNGEETTEILYVQKNKMKSVGPEMIMITDLDKNLLYIVNPKPEFKIYWSGTPEEMRKGIEEMTKQMEEAYLKNMSPEQREQYKQYKESMKEKPKEPATKKKFEVKKTSEKAIVAGYPTRKYQVWVNGELKEELWISSKIKIKDEIDLNKLEKFKEAMSGPEEEESYESSPEYMALMEQGIPLKSINYSNQGNSVNEVKKVEKRKIPDSEFKVPKGYKKISLLELHQLQEMMEQKEEEEEEE
ncbi:DUF4412 domain-containing protein [Candidatus Aerophobetes bacterium]|nr:DUF4412 domain-containing protein [Candidatus Aerophobetes bacterium]